MPVVEIGLVVGYVLAWAVRKARRAGGRLDVTVDTAMDAGLDRLDALVRSKLGGHPALADLDEEAAAAVVGPAAVGSAGSADVDTDDALGGSEGPMADVVSSLTREQLELSLRAAVAKDSGFALQLAEAAAQLRRVAPDTVEHPQITMKATASGHGRVYQAGRDQHINER